MKVSDNSPKKLTIEIPEQWQALFYRLFKLRYVVWVLLLVLGFIAWNHGLALLYGFVALLLAVLAVSLLLPWLYLSRIQVQLLKCEAVHVGDIQLMRLQAQVATKKWGIISHCWGVTVNCANSYFFIPRITASPSILQHQQQASARGHTAFTQAVVSCAYPFGIFTLHKKVAIPCVYRTVYPRFFTINALPHAWLTGGGQSDAQPQRQQYGDDLFMGLRDYQDGDYARRIDWRATARTGDVKVREYEQLEKPSFLMIMNATPALNVGEGERNAFEQSLILAAALANFCVQYSLALKVVGACECVVNSPQQLVDFLQQLAQLQVDPAQQYMTEAQQLMAENNRYTVVVTFNADTELVLPISGHTKHWQFIFNSESYQKPLKRFAVNSILCSGQVVTIPMLATQNIEEVFTRED